LTGDRFVYKVSSTEIVGPDDYYVVTTTDPTVAELTLTSCHPAYTARERIAVHAFLVDDKSDPAGGPTDYDLEANGSEQASESGDPAVESGDTVSPTSAAAATTVPNAVGSPDTTPSATTPTATTPTATTPPSTVAPAQTDQVQDAFG